MLKHLIVTADTQRWESSPSPVYSDSNVVSMVKQSNQQQNKYSVPTRKTSMANIVGITSLSDTSENNISKHGFNENDVNDNIFMENVDNSDISHGDVDVSDDDAFNGNVSKSQQKSPGSGLNLDLQNVKSLDGTNQNPLNSNHSHSYYNNNKNKEDFKNFKSDQLNGKNLAKSAKKSPPPLSPPVWYTNRLQNQKSFEISSPNITSDHEMISEFNDNNIRNNTSFQHNSHPHLAPNTLTANKQSPENDVRNISSTSYFGRDRSVSHDDRFTNHDSFGRELCDSNLIEKNGQKVKTANHRGRRKHTLSVKSSSFASKTGGGVEGVGGESASSNISHLSTTTTSGDPSSYTSTQKSSTENQNMSRLSGISINHIKKPSRTKKRGQRRVDHSMDVTSSAKGGGVKEIILSLALLSLVSTLLALLALTLLFKITSDRSSSNDNEDAKNRASSFPNDFEYWFIYELSLALCYLILILNLCCLLVCSIQFMFAIKLFTDGDGEIRSVRFLKKASLTRTCAVSGFFASIPVFLTNLILYSFLNLHSTSAHVSALLGGLAILFCGCAVVHNVFIWQRQRIKILQVNRHTRSLVGKSSTKSRNHVSSSDRNGHRDSSTTSSSTYGGQNNRSNGGGIFCLPSSVDLGGRRFLSSDRCKSSPANLELSTLV